MAQPPDPNRAANAPQRTVSAGSAASMERPRAAALPTVEPAEPVAVPPSGDPDALPVGFVLGQRYVIEQHISSGGFGAVYRASDREIRHHQVALKILHRPAASELERESALRELMLIASVSHPSVVQFKDYGWHEGRLWFAMPWFRGQTLDRVLGSGDAAVAMSRAEARPIFTRIAQGLAAMHAVGIHHHDIKPENIFLAEIAGFPGGLPVLLDLGIATQRGENPKGLTVEYASPETAAAMLGSAEKPIGSAADVWSLALVLRNALDPSVATPVQTDNVLPILHERATQPVSLPRSRELRYLEPHFRRWLSLEPDERPTAAELADALSVLTEPEEKREARMRLLRRIAPIVAIAALLITALVFQLRKQESALNAQEKQLEAEREQSEELRKKSEAQLDELENQAQKLGNEREQLGRALAIGKQLNAQLAGAEKRIDTLNRKVSKVTSERDGLTLEKQTLTSERDALTMETQKLTTQRERLKSDNATLTNERDELAKERTRLSRERDQLEEQRNALDKRLDAAVKDRNKLEKDLEADKAKYEATARERDEAVARKGELEDRIAKLKNQKEELEARVRELEARAPAGGSSVESADPGKKKPKKKRPAP